MIKLISMLFVSATMAPVCFADPCEAKLPSKAGAIFSGTVKYVGDGDSLCVGTTGDGNEWIEVRIADFDAPESSTKEGQRGKKILTSAVLGKSVTCTVTKGRSGKTTSFDRVHAICRVGGTSIGDMLRNAVAPTGGR
ncbi:MAG: nuclease [Hyphomonadaceae bacterium]